MSIQGEVIIDNNKYLISARRCGKSITSAKYILAELLRSFGKLTENEIAEIVNGLFDDHEEKKDD